MIRIRHAVLEDAERILDIYSYYILHTAITFEYDIPPLPDFRARMEKIMARYPYLVLEKDGRIAGYAYAHPYIERAACDWSCEASIYFDHQATGQGLGRQLYAALEDALGRMGMVNMYASIALPQGEDPFVDDTSLVFHEACGFRVIGSFRKCGFKFGRWYDLIWVEKTLGSHEAIQEDLIPYPVLRTSAGADSGDVVKS